MFSSSTYEDTYDELELIGKGSFGTNCFTSGKVYKVMCFRDMKIWAAKKI